MYSIKRKASQPVCPRFVLTSTHLSLQCRRLRETENDSILGCLNKAIRDLRDIALMVDSGQVLSYKAYPGVPRLISNNPAFLDFTSNIICQAATQLRHYAGSKHFECQVQMIENGRPEFWIMNAVCYIGSRSLLDVLLSPVFSDWHGLPETYMRDTAVECLPTTIRNHHWPLTEYIIRNARDDYRPIWKYPYANVFAAAISECDIQAIELIIYKYVGNEDLCTKIAEGVVAENLTFSRSVATLPETKERFSKILLLLCPFWSPATRPYLQSYIVMTIARLGCAADIHWLADHNALSSVHAQMLGVSEVNFGSTIKARTALCSAAIAGKLDVLEALLDRYYLAEVSNTRIRIAVMAAAEQALLAGHLHLYTGLRNRFADAIRSMKKDFELLALLKDVDAPKALRGKIESANDIQDFLSQQPNVRNSGTKQSTKGASAVYIAVRSLRWRNVEMLLSFGLKFDSNTPSVGLPWTICSRRKEAYERTQNILAAHNLPTLHVSI